MGKFLRKSFLVNIAPMKMKIPKSGMNEFHMYRTGHLLSLKSLPYGLDSAANFEIVFDPADYITYRYNFLSSSTREGSRQPISLYVLTGKGEKLRYWSDLEGHVRQSLSILSAMLCCATLLLPLLLRQNSTTSCFELKCGDSLSSIT